jgi:hypothetical protein
VGSNGSEALRGRGDGAGNERATITFAVVYAVWPLGNPGGIAYPVGSKNGWRWSMPSSMIAIFMPCPAVLSAGPQSVGAPMAAGLRSRSGR